MTVTVPVTGLAALPTGAARRVVYLGTPEVAVPPLQALVAAGEDVTVFTRAGSDRSALDGLKLDYAIGDLLDEKSIAATFDAKAYRALVDASANRASTGKGGGPDRDSNWRSGRWSFTKPNWVHNWCDDDQCY